MMLYDDVCIAGNGPSGISLSYMLSGYWPYYSGDTHSNEYLHMRLQDGGGKSLIQQVKCTLNMSRVTEKIHNLSIRALCGIVIYRLYRYFCSIIHIVSFILVTRYSNDTFMLKFKVFCLLKFP